MNWGEFLSKLLAPVLGALGATFITEWFNRRRPRRSRAPRRDQG